MNNLNSNLHTLKIIKLKRLIPYYKKLKIDAIKKQDFESAYKLRELEKDCRDGLNDLFNK